MRLKSGDGAIAANVSKIILSISTDGAGPVTGPSRSKNANAFFCFSKQNRDNRG
jgi:hypothetical protein